MTLQRTPRDTITSCSECGWKSKRTTAGLARHALELHSCALQRTRDERSARFRQRMDRVDREPKPCRHKNAQHQHGTYAAYTLDFCRCPPCARAQSAYERKRLRQQAYGTWNKLVDAEPVRRHIAELQATGMGLKQIGKAAGIGGGNMMKLMYGFGDRPPARRVRPNTATRVLAVTVQLAGGARVDACGTTRRLQALAVNGWSIAALAARYDIDPQPLRRALSESGKSITVRTRDLVQRIYDELWDQTPTGKSRWEVGAIRRLMRSSVARGWAPALAWDDDEIDDPTATPHQPKSSRQEDRREDRGQQLDAVAKLTARGLSAAAIADRLGLTDRTVTRMRAELAAADPLEDTA